jgi:hypothetical protein
MKLNTKIVCASLFVSMLLVSLSVGTHIVKGDSIDSPYASSGPVTIFSPLNRTYNSRFLTLEITYNRGGLEYSLNYSIDGKYEGPISLVAKNPTEFHVVNQGEGLVKLRELSDGSHCLTVCSESYFSNYGGVNPPGGPFKPTTPNGTDYSASWAATVYFTIDSNQPNVSDLSLENKTYFAPDVPLNFTVNENAPQLTYSLDGLDNVTIAGNITLTGLSIGAHNVTVYVWDDAGNVGASQTISFAIASFSTLSPQNQTYTATDVPLTFIVNGTTLQITYSLDGQENVTIDGNTTLTGLGNGDHNLTIYTKDEAGKIEVSETIYFNVEVPFPTTLAVAASGTSLAVIAVGLLVYLRKRSQVRR